LRLSRRVESLRPSATLEVKATADRLKERGVDVIDFGPGEPDFDTPEVVKAAGKRAIDENLSHYLPTRGLKALRTAVAESYKSRYGVDYSDSDVLVGCGAKGVLYLAAMAILSEGDEAIIPSPYWVSFPEQVRLAGADAVILPTSERTGFTPRAIAAESLITDRTRAIILCSPSNPTGGVMMQEDVDRFVELAVKHDLFLVFDETYEHYLYDGAVHATPARSGRKGREHVLLVSSASKSYAMTGWRVGYALGPSRLIAAMASLQGHDTTHTAAVAQAAAAEAIASGGGALEAMLAEYARRRLVMVEGLKSTKGISCSVPQGAFYVFPNVTGLYDRFKVKDSASVSKCLLEEAQVATVPGEAFGAPGYLRFSYALSLDRIKEGLDRIKRCVG